MISHLIRPSLLVVLAPLVVAALCGGTHTARATSPRATAPSGHGTACARGSVAAPIGGKRVCLRAGQRCKAHYDRQYRRHGFHCQAGRLKRVRKASPPPPPPPPPPPSAGPPAGTITATISEGHALGRLAAGEGAIWVENRDQTVSRIDPATNAVVATVKTPFTPNWIAAGDGGVWISNYAQNSITRIDPATNTVVATISVGVAPTGIALTPGAVWVANHHSGSLTRIDPATNTVVATIPVGAYREVGPVDVVAVGGSVWFVADEASGGMVERLDPATSTVVARIPLNSPASLGTDGASLWVGAFNEGKIYPVDLGGDTFGTPITAPLMPLVIGVGLGSVWSLTPSGFGGSGPEGLVRYDPVAGTVVGETVYAAAGGLVVGYGAVWVGRSDEKILRIEP